MNKKKRILIVEDEELISQMLVEYFALVDPDLECVVAESLKEAREKLKKEQWDLCICDCRLPDGSACDLFVERAFSCPVIVTTGYVDQEEYARARSSCHNLVEVVKKPYLPEELYRKIKEILK